MSYQIRISEEAESEINKAKGWYEKQSYGLGEKFENDLKLEIESLLDFTIDHKTTHANHRRLLMYRFPYIIYYKREERTRIVEITSVLHNKQQHHFD